MPFDLKPTKNNRQPIQKEDSRLERYFSKPPQEIEPANEPEEFEEETERQPAKNIGKILHQWQAPEFEVYEKSKRWYLIAGLLDLGLITYAIYTDGPIMAITFIMLGIVGYIHLQKDPRVITFSFTTKGIVADKELYAYENIHSFWIFYEPPHSKILSLHTKASIFPYVHIPMDDEDPVALRKTLLPYIPEIKQEQSLVDTIEKVFHI